MMIGTSCALPALPSPGDTIPVEIAAGQVSAAAQTCECGKETFLDVMLALLAAPKDAISNSAATQKKSKEKPEETTSAIPAFAAISIGIEIVNDANPLEKQVSTVQIVDPSIKGHIKPTPPAAPKLAEPVLEAVQPAIAKPNVPSPDGQLETPLPANNAAQDSLTPKHAAPAESTQPAPQPTAERLTDTIVAPKGPHEPAANLAVLAKNESFNIAHSVPQAVMAMALRTDATTPSQDLDESTKWTESRRPVLTESATVSNSESGRHVEQAQAGRRPCP